MNEDKSPLWGRFDIQAVPALAAFPDGKMVPGRDSRLGVNSDRGVRDSILKAM